MIYGALESAGEEYASQNSISFETGYHISTIKNTSGGVMISWDKQDDAYKYVLYYKIGDNGTWKKATTTKNLIYTQKSLKSGYTYYFYGTCLDKKGKMIPGSTSNTKSIMYIAPPALKSATVDKDGILVTWKRVVGAAGYRVLMKDAEGNWNEINGKDTTEVNTSVLIDGLTSGNCYSFTVECLDSEGNVVSAYNTKGKDATYVSPSTITAVTNVNPKSMNIYWYRNYKVDGYQIQYSTYKDFEKSNKTVTITVGANTSSEVKKLSVGKTYYVRIRSWIKIGKTKYYSAWTTTADANVTINK